MRTIQKAAIVAVLAAVLGLAAPASAAPVPIVCNQTWQVIPPQVSSLKVNIYGGSAFNASGEDYIGVVAIINQNYEVIYTVLDFANPGAIAWRNVWSYTGFQSQYSPKVLNASESGYNRVEVRARGLDGNTWSLLFNGPGNTGPWFQSGSGAGHYNAAPVHNAFATTGNGGAGQVWLTTGLGAPMSHCWH
jgi:hypothetical protein